MRKPVPSLFIFLCLFSAQIYAEASNYLYYKNKAGGNTARIMYDGKWWYKYDANGNRITKASDAHHEDNTVTINPAKEYWEYEWDYHNRLIKVQQHNAPDNAANVCVEYTYDALNRRIERISRTQPEPEITQYAYGRNGTLTYQKKITGGNNTERTYVYLNNQIAAFVDTLKDGTEKIYYTVTDIQGSVTEVYDAELQLVWKSDYTAFGIKAGETVDLIDFDGLYTGCDFDAETGLSYHWNRWRSEDGNSWLSQDPARDGLNWYGYAGQNPVNYIDPDGLAHFGKRPMKTFNNYWGIAASNPIDNMANTELSHEQLFFDDNKDDNIGFSWEGLFEEQKSEYSKYHMDKKQYDDELMRQAVSNVKSGEYSVIGKTVGKLIQKIAKIFGKKVDNKIIGNGKKNNCQDWASNVRKEYKHLLKELPKEKQKEIKKECKKREKENQNEE